MLVRMIGATVMALGAATTVAAQTADRFNLVCEGELSTGRVGEARETEAWSPSLRVDLVARQFCWEPCERRLSIHTVDADRIVLNDNPDGYAPQALDRRTLRLTNDLLLPRISFRVQQEAQCAPTPFVDFPREIPAVKPQ